MTPLMTPLFEVSFSRSVKGKLPYRKFNEDLWLLENICWESTGQCIWSRVTYQRKPKLSSLDYIMYLVRNGDFGELIKTWFVPLLLLSQSLYFSERFDLRLERLIWRNRGKLRRTVVSKPSHPRSDSIVSRNTGQAWWEFFSIGL